MLNANIRPADLVDDRSAARVRLLVEASSDSGAGPPVELTVHDLSTTGILFAADHPFSPQMLITIDVADIGTMQAKVVWSGGRFQGAEFTSPLSQSMAAAIRERSKVVWPAFSVPVEDPVRHRNPADSTFHLEAPPLCDEDPERLAPAAKIRVVVSLALLSWTGLAFGTWSLIA